MPVLSSQDFARALSGAVGGALGGGAAGATIGALRAPEGEDRKQYALSGARKGALGGAALGGSMMAVPPVLANLLEMRANQMDAQRQAAVALGYQDPAFDNMVDALVSLRDRLREVIPAGALGALGAGAAGAASSRVGSEVSRQVAGRLRQKMFPKDRGAVAAESPIAYGDGEAAKTGTAGVAAPEDSPQEQRTRRLAELLKKVVPTTSAGGSTAPTSPRGTP